MNLLLRLVNRLLCLVNLLSRFTKYVVVFSKYCVAFAVVGHRSMEIVIVVLYCHINSITIVILIADCFDNKSRWFKSLHTTKLEPMDMGRSASNDIP